MLQTTTYLPVNLSILLSWKWLQRQSTEIARYAPTKKQKSTQDQNGLQKPWAAAQRQCIELPISRQEFKTRCCHIRQKFVHMCTSYHYCGPACLSGLNLCESIVKLSFIHLLWLGRKFVTTDEDAQGVSRELLIIKSGWHWHRSHGEWKFIEIPQFAIKPPCRQHLFVAFDGQSVSFEDM